MEHIILITYVIALACVTDILFADQYSFLKKMFVVVFFIIGSAIVWEDVDKAYKYVSHPKQHIYTFVTIDNDTYENGTNCSRYIMTCELNNQVYKVKEFKETGYH